MEPMPETKPMMPPPDLKAELQEWRMKFDVIYHESPDGIMILDPQSSEILDVNQTVFRVLGYCKEMLIGKTFSSLFPIEKNEANNQSATDVHIHGVAVAGQNFVRANGSICPMDLTYNMIPWHGEFAMMITLRDVTSRVEAEAAQTKLIEELDAFAHTVAHDLKAPLTTLLGASSTFDAFGADLSLEDQLGLIDIMTISGKKMRNIIDELLLLAEMRNKEIETYPLDMTKVIIEVEQRLSYTIDQTDTEIVAAKDWPTSIGYAPWVEEVWANYVSNAIKYGGSPPRIELGSTIEAQSVRFWVKDNGEGLTLAQQSKLFTPFTQLNVRTKGQGLGLSIVQRIVEKLSGTVGVESQVGQGSKFSFTLPRLQQ
ncbi:MAG: PAS domain-containing sensor histidine kinase [Chloroflexota bacterium]